VIQVANTQKQVPGSPGEVKQPTHTGTIHASCHSRCSWYDVIQVAHAPCFGHVRNKYQVKSSSQRTPSMQAAIAHTADVILYYKTLNQVANTQNKYQMRSSSQHTPSMQAAIAHICVHRCSYTINIQEYLKSKHRWHSMQAAQAMMWISQMSKDSCSTTAGCSNAQAVRDDPSRSDPTKDIISSSTLIQNMQRHPIPSCKAVRMRGIRQMDTCHTVMISITHRPFAKGTLAYAGKMSTRCSEMRDTCHEAECQIEPAENQNRICKHRVAASKSV
jgi:hypothetical protein